MRKQLLGVFLPLLIVLMVAAETQSAGTGATAQAAKHAVLRAVDVVRGNDGISIEVTAVGAVSPKVSTLKAPARVVLDLPNTVAVTEQRHIAVGSDGVDGVRVGMDGQVPPTTRVVVDLQQAMSYDLVPGSDKLVLKIHPGTVAKTAAPAAPKVAKATTPKVEVGSQTTPVVTAAKPAEDKKPVTSAASTTPEAKDFAFIEPSYQPKDANSDGKPAPKPLVIELPVRAIEAAAKFSDKPAAELLPKPSASLQAQSANAPAVNMAAEQKQQMSQSSAMTGPKYTGEPISVNLKDVDLKDFFRLIHEISGLNVVLDPNVKGTLTIVLDDVPWDQALDIVLKNNDLSRQLEGNVLRIATVETLKKEADARRAQVEAEALAVDKITVTRFLSYAHAKDVVATVKNFLSQRGDVIADERTNALIVQDIPNTIPAIDRLLQQLDRKTQEVEIEARVVAATRSFARDIGTQLGFGWGNAANAIGGASSVGTSPTQVFNVPAQYVTIGGSATTAGTQIPLFSNLPVTSPTSGLNFVNVSRNVRIDAVLTLAESRGLLKILSRPRVVTQNNIQALVRQGVRVPIVTQAQLGGPPTVSYVDAFLRLTVTPQITSENTIFLNVDVENTTPDFGRTVQGNPTLITQQATTQVLVTDGGTVVIGGVIQTQNSVNIAQVPLLGNIPALGNLFKRRSVSTSNQELIFFITPRIIQT